LFLVKPFIDHIVIIVNFPIPLSINHIAAPSTMYIAYIITSYYSHPHFPSLVVIVCPYLKF